MYKYHRWKNGSLHKKRSETKKKKLYQKHYLQIKLQITQWIHSDETFLKNVHGIAKYYPISLSTFATQVSGLYQQVRELDTWLAKMQFEVMLIYIQNTIEVKKIFREKTING